MATQTEKGMQVVKVSIPRDTGFADGGMGSPVLDTFFAFYRLFITFLKWVITPIKQSRMYKDLKMENKKVEKIDNDCLEKNGLNPDGSCEKEFDANLTLRELLKELDFHHEDDEYYKFSEMPLNFMDTKIANIPKNEVTEIIKIAQMLDW